MADVGIWFRFETHAEHNCDVMVLSDYEQGYAQVADMDNKPPSGTLDGGTESVWDIRLHSEVVASSVEVNDYNYRTANTALHKDINTQPKNTTTYGSDYRYEEHYKGLNDNGQTNQRSNDHNDNNANDTCIESGEWYARLRHEQKISQHVIISGKSNRYALAPGQWINLNGSPLNNINNGVIILSVQGHGNRTDAYELEFTAIPYQALVEWQHIFKQKN